MPLRNRFAQMQTELTAIRRDLHENPELQYDTHRTSALVAQLLQKYGCDDAVTGIGRTGVVGVIKGRQDTKNRCIGLRADTDALPIEEATGLPYASKTARKMHACGHDGHTTMLLGAAQYLCETRNFDDTVIVIFQPAEEGGAGVKAMCDDGLMQRCNIEEVYGMHNWPNMDLGTFHIRYGPFFASTDTIDVTIMGRGGHAAMPHETIDSVVTASHMVTALQTIASRNSDPVQNIVVSVTSFETDTTTFNVIAQKVRLKGTIRTLDPATRTLAQERVLAIINGTAATFGERADIDFQTGYPVMINEDEMTGHARAAAIRVAGDCGDAPLVMGGEDFAFMAQERPGAYILVGNGPSAHLHHHKYNFNDDAIGAGGSWWVEIAEGRMPIG